MPERIVRAGVSGVGVDEHAVLRAERQHRDLQEAAEFHTHDY